MICDIYPDNFHGRELQSGFSHVQQVLLCKATSRIVNEINYMCNTPLHMAAAVSNVVTLEKQKEVCRLLIQAGGQTNIQNRQGKTPLALVSPERKEAIKKIFYKKLWWLLIDAAIEFDRSRTLHKTDLYKCSKEQAFKLHEDFPFRLDSRHVYRKKMFKTVIIKLKKSTDEMCIIDHTKLL